MNGICILQNMRRIVSGDDTGVTAMSGQQTLSRDESTLIVTLELIMEITMVYRQYSTLRTGCNSDHSSCL